MKDISNQLKQHLASEVLTIAYCLKITLQNKQIIGLTDFDQTLTIDNITYESTPGLNIDILRYNSTIGHSAKINITNSNLIKEEHIISGLYDSAKAKIFLVNYTNLTQENIILFYGNIEKITLTNHNITVELCSLFNTISKKNIGELFSSSCRAQFCDNKCKLSKELFTNTYNITRIISNQEFECTHLTNIENYYTYGLITFITGKNSNFTSEIKSHNKSYVKLYNSLPYEISLNDKFTIIAGCDKSFITCSNKFNNSINFRGEPHIPEIYF